MAGIIQTQTQAVDKTTTLAAPLRARYYKVGSDQVDFDQFNRTIQAYIDAGLPFEHIANAGEHLGYPVQKGDIDAPFKPDWKQKVSDIKTGENQILAWQNRGEIADFNHQLSQPVTGKELISTAGNLIPNPNNPAVARIQVIEGINVSKTDPPGIVDQYNQAELSSPLLKNSA